VPVDGAWVALYDELERWEPNMKVNISPDQKAFIREAIENGRFRSEEDALQEALALWEERERARSEILAAVDKAEDSIARGEGRIITRASMRALAKEVKRRGRARVLGKRNFDTR
jgi:putative addiction module CopG family antidote